MKEYLRHLLNAEDRPLLIRLTFGPCDVTTLAQISGLSPAQTALRLQALKEIDLVSNTDAEEEFSLAPVIRKKSTAWLYDCQSPLVFSWPEAY